MKLPKLNVEKLKTLEASSVKQVVGGVHLGDSIESPIQRGCGVCSQSI